ncbi:MAG: GNAT family N-acetyltransferase [Gammaproteobacteria bacterium]
MHIRPARHDDFPAILALNAESVRFLSPLTLPRLQALHEQAAVHAVIEDEGSVTAFVLALREGAEYDSVNYQWFGARYPHFLYIDRVVVSEDYQGRGAGTLLYEQVFERARLIGTPVVACEFDVDPPNPASERFHAKLGFLEVGRQAVAGGQKEVSLQVASR